MHMVVLCLLCCGNIINFWWIYLIHLAKSFMIASLVLGQSLDCPSASEVAMKHIGKSYRYLTMMKYNPEQIAALYRKEKLLCLFIGIYSIWGLWCQKQVSQAGISNCIPQNTVGCNYLSLPVIPASGTYVLIWWIYRRVKDWRTVYYQHFSRYRSIDLLSMGCFDLAECTATLGTVEFCLREDLWQLLSIEFPRLFRLKNVLVHCYVL